MPVEGVTVTKIIEPKLLGVFKAHNVYLCHGKYGEYLRYNSKFESQIIFESQITTLFLNGLKWRT
jgi:hypothetical protein